MKHPSPSYKCLQRIQANSKKISKISNILSYQHTLDNGNLRAHVLLNMKTCRGDPRGHFEIRFLSPLNLFFPIIPQPFYTHISEKITQIEFHDLKNEH